MSNFLVLLKPDAFFQGKSRQIIERLIGSGVQITSCVTGIPTPSLVEQHYSHLPPLILQRNVKFLCSGPVLKLEVIGEIPRIRAVIGSTDPSKASPGTIRGDFANDSRELADLENRGIRNLIHASDSDENGKLELALWSNFPGKEKEEQCKEVLALTQDGKELQPQDFNLIKTVLSGSSNPVILLKFQMLVGVILSGRYINDNDWTAGVPNVTMHADGILRWKGIPIEPFVATSNQPEIFNKTVTALARKCLLLEALGLPVSRSNYTNNWLNDANSSFSAVQLQFLSRLREPYEHPDGRIAFEIQAFSPNEVRYLQVEGQKIRFIREQIKADSCCYSVLARHGFVLASCGASVSAVATGRQVLNWATAHKLDGAKMQRLLDLERFYSEVVDESFA